MTAPALLFSRALVGRALLAVEDGYQYLLPLRVIAARQWRHGQVPVWNPFGFSGYPLLATAQAGVFYPPNALFLVASPVVAYNIGIVLAFAVAGAGAFALAHRLWGDALAASGAGAAFGFCGFMFGHVAHPNVIASACWLPWVLFGYRLLLDRVTPGRLFGTAAAVAAALIAGHPQMFFIDILLFAVYALASGAAEQRVRPLVLGVLVVVAGAALASAQLIPTALLLPDTARAKIPYELATAYSFPGSHLPLLLFPYLFGNSSPVHPYVAAYHGRFNLHELSGYVGAGALVLAVAGMTRRWRTAFPIAVMGAVALLIAVGNTAPTGRLVYALPVYGQFRSWGRYVVGLDLAVALLAAGGLAWLRDPAREQRVRAATRTAVAVVVIVLIAGVVPMLREVHRFLPLHEQRIRAAIGPPCFAAVLCGVASLAAVRFRQAAAVAVVAILVVDPVITFGGWFEWRNAPSVADLVSDFRPGGSPPFDRTGPATGITRHAFSLQTPVPVSASTTAEVRLSRLASADVTGVKSLRSINGSEPLILQAYSDAVGDMSDAGQIQHPQQISAETLDLLRVSIVFANGNVADAMPARPALVDRGPAVGGPEVRRYDYTPRVNDVWLVGATRVANRHQIDRWLWTAGGIDSKGTALVEHRCRRCPDVAVPGEAGSANHARWKPATVGFDVDARRPAIAVVSQTWSRGWHAVVDGKPAPVVRVDGLVQGVPVGVGRHHIKLSYTAPGLSAGAIASVLSAIAIGAWAVVRRTARRRALRLPTRSLAQS